MLCLAVQLRVLIKLKSVTTNSNMTYFGQIIFYIGPQCDFLVWTGSRIQ
jgi:hypothetical protein